jgi:hypothetical protein
MLEGIYLSHNKLCSIKIKYCNGIKAVIVFMKASTAV